MGKVGNENPRSGQSLKPSSFDKTDVGMAVSGKDLGPLLNTLGNYILTPDPPFFVWVSADEKAGLTHTSSTWCERTSDPYFCGVTKQLSQNFC